MIKIYTYYFLGLIEHGMFNHLKYPQLVTDTGSGQGMRCDAMKPFIEGLWIARVPADHAWRAITGADGLKWNEINEMNVEK